MTSLRRQVLSEGGWVLAGYVSTTAASLIGLRLLTSFLAPDVFGTVNLLLGALQLSTHLFIAPFQSAAFRFYSEVEGHGDLPRLRHVVKRYLLRWGSLLLLLILAGGLVFSLWREVPYPAFVALAALLAVQVTRAFEHNLMWAARRQRPIALLQIGDAWTKPLLAIGAVWLIGPSPQAVLSGHLVSELIGLCALLAWIPREGLGRYEPAPQADAELARGIRSYAWPLAPVALANWVSNLSDRYIIGALVGSAGVGLYAASYGLVATPFLTTQSITGQTLSPHYFRAISANNGPLARKAFRAWFLGTLAPCAAGVIGIWLLRDWIAWLFLAEEYRSGSELMPWIALGSAICACGMVLTLRLQAYKRTKAVMLAHAIGAVAAIGVTVPLTWKWGVLGAAIACPIYYGILFTALAVLGRQSTMAVDAPAPGAAAEDARS